jgi:hypothetical protein
MTACYDAYCLENNWNFFVLVDAIVEINYTNKLF